jgi:predicted dienelactone hydrolase
MRSLLKPRHFLAALLAFCLAQTSWAFSVGIQHVELPDASASQRKLTFAVLYPTTASGPTSTIAENPVFIGHEMVENAPMEPKARPLVLLSHGLGGNWRNQLWLAKKLVQQGYVVAAPSHPGTTTGDNNNSTGAQLWERPRDLSRVVDFLSRSPKWAAAVDATQVAAIGHSLGGWTVMQLGGSRFDPQRLAQDCVKNSGFASCTAYEKMGAGRDAASRALLGRSMRDPRVRAVVSFDLGLARGLDPASLSNFPVPALVIGAGPHHKELPSDMESGLLAKLLPSTSTQAMTIDDAGHFSFLQLCKPGGIAILEKEEPGDGMICIDGGGRGRAAIHQQVEKTVIDFLHKAGFKP